MSQEVGGTHGTKIRSEGASFRVDCRLASGVESADKSTRGGETESHAPSGAASSFALAAAASSSAPAVASRSSAGAEQFESDEVPDHGVQRVRWSPQVQDTSELDPSESSVRLQGLKRQPGSTTEDPEDVDQGDADDADMKTMGAVCEEPVITIGIDGEKLNECVTDEESHVDDVNGGFLDPVFVREARVEQVAGYLAMQVYCSVPVGECASYKVI